MNGDKITIVIEKNPTFSLPIFQEVGSVYKSWFSFLKFRSQKALIGYEEYRSSSSPCFLHFALLSA
jgi:hypothetical protein